MAFNLVREVFSLAELPGVASQLAEVWVKETLSRPVVVGISGGMGAGKTTLVRGVVAHLHGSPEVTSPTFDLIHVHNGPRCTVVHIDLYRLSPDEVGSLDLDHYLQTPGVLMLIEWPERATDIVLDGVLTLTRLENENRQVGLMFKNNFFWERGNDSCQQGGLINE